jgi:hypothetical protein
MIGRVVTCGALVCSVLALVGCSEGRMRTAEVNGTVTYKGKPVPQGTVTFIPDAGGPSATGEIKDGAFSMTTYVRGDGAVLGKHKVVIAAMQDMKDRLPEDRNPLPPPIVPTKYTSPATTTLTTLVEDKENTPVFDLKD